MERDAIDSLRGHFANAVGRTKKIGHQHELDGMQVAYCVWHFEQRVRSTIPTFRYGENGFKEFRESLARQVIFFDFSLGLQPGFRDRDAHKNVP
jgi:hypothetical protein